MEAAQVIGVENIAGLNISREERSFQAVGRAAEEVRLSGERLKGALERWQAAVDDLTEERIGSASLMMDKPTESFYAAWRNETRPSVESATDRELGEWSLRVDA